ncbi:MAG: alpha/beta fold hydrolase [Gammaproteobacteria bacterium]
MVVETPVAELHFEQYGAGAPIVILHGLFGSARNWRSVAHKLAADFRVIAVDLRNHGSSPHLPDMSYNALSIDVSALLEKLDLDDVTLIGHSMGGKAAMTLSLAEPERIARLVVVDIGPGPYDNEFDNILTAMSDLDLRTVTRRAEASDRLKQAIPDNDIRLFILQNLNLSTGRSLGWRINLPAIRAEIAHLVGAIPRDRGSSFDGATYFIRGENSQRVADQQLALIGQYFPGYELITITDAGHWPHAENPTEFFTTLRQILL